MSIDKGESIDVIYLDFAKAFDKVPHRRLLAKVKGLGIQDKVLRWISSRLTDHSQRVCINGEQSAWRDVWSRDLSFSLGSSTILDVYKRY